MRPAMLAYREPQPPAPPKTPHGHMSVLRFRSLYVADI